MKSPIFGGFRTSKGRLVSGCPKQRRRRAHGPAGALATFRGAGGAQWAAGDSAQPRGGAAGKERRLTMVYEN